MILNKLKDILIFQAKLKEISTKTLDSVNQRELERQRDESFAGNEVNLRQSPPAFQFSERPFGSRCIYKDGFRKRSFLSRESPQEYQPSRSFKEIPCVISEQHTKESFHGHCEKINHGLTKYHVDESSVICEGLKEVSYFQPHKPHKRSEEKSLTLDPCLTPIICDQNENLMISSSKLPNTCVHYNILVNKNRCRCPSTSIQHCQCINLSPMLYDL